LIHLQIVGREIIDLHGFSRRRIDKMLNALATCVEPGKSQSLWRPQHRLLKDKMVLEAAVNGFAGYLVTVNSRDFFPAARRFGIRVCLIAQFFKNFGENPMSQVALKLPDSLHQYAKQLAADDDASLNQFIVMTVAEKVSAYKTEAFFKERAAKGCVEKANKLLLKSRNGAQLKGEEI
jgi:predicted HicB family RNase H-like nuclease